MARTVTLTLSPRERAALAMWFMDLVAPKTRQERRVLQTMIEEFCLDSDMDAMAGTRPGLRTLSNVAGLPMEVTEGSIRYVLEEIDPSKKPGVTGHIHSILGPLDDRLTDLLKASPG